jgi:hypothetical protein
MQLGEYGVLLQVSLALVLSCGLGYAQILSTLEKVTDIPINQPIRDTSAKESYRAESQLTALKTPAKQK